MNIKNVLFLLLVSTPIISWASAPSESMQCPPDVLKYLRLASEKLGSVPNSDAYDFIVPATVQEVAGIADEMVVKSNNTKSFTDSLYYGYAANHFLSYWNFLQKEQALKLNEQLQKEIAELKKQLAAAKEANEVPSVPGGPKQNVQPSAVNK